jgi:ABC-type multidrug transport system ATPase subunit/ABC-type multidrug transport system permease subunit
MPPCCVDFTDVSYAVPERSARSLSCWPFGRTSGAGESPDQGPARDVEAGVGQNPPRQGDGERQQAHGRRRSGKPMRQIISHVSGHVCGGEMLAILGPSGSGKTSLLNVVSGREERVPDSGKILFGGHARNSRTKRIMAYVQQDDVFFTKLTVRETLEFAASLRAKNSEEHRNRTSRVDDVLARLRLEKCQHTIVGNQELEKGISGGERKRLNIAYELLSEPDVLLLDEPTSGQDASNAMAIIRLLRNLANEGKTIILTIHQPSSAMFELFDKLMLLSEGEVVYFGETSRAESYFASIGHPFQANYNPCDFMMQLLIDAMPRRLPLKVDGESIPTNDTGRKALTTLWSERLNTNTPEAHSDMASGRAVSEGPQEVKTYGQNLCTSLKASGPARAVTKRAHNIMGKPDPSGLPEKYETSWISQVLVLSLRALRQRRGRLFDPVSFFQFFLITVVCALFWFRIKDSESHLSDRIGVLFFYCAFWGFLSSASAVYAFPPEKEVISKDRASGSYRLSAYYCAKCAMEIPVDVVYPVLFSSVVYWANNLNPHFDRFLIFVVVFSLTTLVAQGFGLFFSAALLNAQYASTLSLLWNLTSMLMAGYYVHSDNIPGFIRPLVYLSYIRYGFAALVRNEVSGRTYACVDPSSGGLHTEFSLNGKECPRVSPQAVLRGAQLEDTPPIFVNVLALIGWCIFYRFLGYLSLKYLHRPHKPKRKNA